MARRRATPLPFLLLAVLLLPLAVLAGGVTSHGLAAGPTGSSSTAASSSAVISQVATTTTHHPSPTTADEPPRVMRSSHAEPIPTCDKNKHPDGEQVAATSDTQRLPGTVTSPHVATLAAPAPKLPARHALALPGAPRGPDPPCPARYLTTVLRV